jgi:hypothetical protein
VLNTHFNFLLDYLRLTHPCGRFLVCVSLSFVRVAIASESL